MRDHVTNTPAASTVNKVAEVADRAAPDIAEQLNAEIRHRYVKGASSPPKFPKDFTTYKYLSPPLMPAKSLQHVQVF